MKDGLFLDLPDTEYFANPAINCSGLKIIAQKTPLHFKSKQEEPREETPALIIGSAVHCLTLEPDLFSVRYVIAPKIDKRTKAGKEQWADLEATGRIVLSEDDADKIMRIADAVRTHKTASKLITGGFAEVSVFTKIDGTPAKCKCDYLRENVAIIDLKTTEDASKAGFMRSVIKYGYHQQAAWYLDCLEAYGKPVDAFVFIAVEKTAPFAVGIYELDADTVQLGRELNERALRVYQDCLQTNVWQGYSEQIELLNAPAWAYKENIEA